MEPFYEIPGYPEQVSGSTIMTRMLDGLGFRFYWATEGLRQEDYAFRPSPDSRSLGEVVGHIWGLVNWISIHAFQRSYARPNEPESVRLQALRIIEDLRNAVVCLSDDELAGLKIEGRPVWNIVNGPLSDALTHVGQVNAFRRLNGNPVHGANVFLGIPPGE